MATLDFPNIEPRGEAELLPEGLYKVEITKWEKVKGKQADQIRFYAKVLEAHLDEVLVKEWCDKKGVEPTKGMFKGKSLVDHVSLSEKATWRLVWFLHESLLIDTKSLPKMSTSSEIFDRLLNMCQDRKMWWEVSVKSFDGKENNKVTNYMPVDEQGPADIGDLEGEVPAWVSQK